MMIVAQKVVPSTRDPKLRVVGSIPIYRSKKLRSPEFFFYFTPIQSNAKVHFVFGND
jgi:hypothetical protein